MSEESTGKINFKKLLWVTLAVFLLVACVGLYLKYGCYFLDTRTFLSPVYFSGNIPIRQDSYGEGEFGAKRSGKRLHLGADILAAVGTPVYAAKCGLVINAEYNNGLGNYVEILHRSGLVTIYAHLSRMNVYQGQRVCQGQKIGEIGKTGNAKNRLILAHLHFEVRKYGAPQDPMTYLPSK